MKCCIICIARNENRYIDEWVKYHIGLGVDHIYICDNNPIGGEKISNIVDNNEAVTILENYHECKYPQPEAYTECFLKYRSLYDWLIFIDIDEFIILDSIYPNIKSFLSESQFKSVDIIRLYWKNFSGEPELDVINNDYRVLGRFMYQSPYNQRWNLVKSIIRGNIEYKRGAIYGHGYFRNHSLVAVDAIGNRIQNIWSSGNSCPVYENAWINHYPTKTIGEYVRQKYFRGGPNNNDSKYSNLDYFFQFNPYREDVEAYGKDLIEKIKILK